MTFPRKMTPIAPILPKQATFAGLPIGAVFIFAAERTMPYAGLALGPWIKTSARKYKHLHIEGLDCRVGSIRALVELDRD